MDTSVCIVQKGTVEKVAEHLVKVSVHRDTACGHCHARGFCEMGSQSQAIIESSDFTDGLKTGDTVEVIIAQRQGGKAVMLAYFIPFVLMMVILVIMQSIGIREWITGLAAVTALVPYFLLLHIFRNKIKKIFSFSVRKTEV